MRLFDALHPIALALLATAQDPAPACRAEVRDSSRLRLLGRAAYVEPRAAASGGAGALLVGAPTLLWPPARGSATERPTLDSLFGASIAMTGVARPVPRPPGVWPIRHVRLLADGPDAYWALFDQMDMDTTSPWSDRVWWARYERGRWTQPTRVPLPPQTLTNVRSASALVRLGGGIAFAAALQPKDSTPSVALFAWVDGRWRTTSVIRQSAAYVALSGNDSSLMVAVIHGDETGEWGNNTIYLARRTNGRWGPEERVHRGPAHAPAFTHAGGRTYLAWSKGSLLAPHELRLFDLATGRVRVLDSASVLAADPLSVDGAPAFAIVHQRADGTQSLRLILVRPAATELLLEIPNPFHATTAATRLGSGDILVHGLGMVRDSLGRDASTLLLRLRVACAREPRSK